MLNLLFYTLENTNKKILKIAANDPCDLEYLCSIMRELAKGKLKILKSGDSEVNFINFSTLLLSIKANSFCQFITKTENDIIWEASIEDWKDNIELIAALLNSNKGSHQYFGGYGSDIVAEICFKE